MAAGPLTEVPGLSEYMQATFALGFLSLTHITSLLVRTVLVNSTQPEGSASTNCDAEAQKPALVSSFSSWKLGLPQQAPLVDDPRRRFWFRRWSESIFVLYLAALVLCVVATSHIYGADDTTANHRNEALRWGSTLIFSRRSSMFLPGMRAPQLDWWPSSRWPAYSFGPEKLFLRSMSGL
jgi:hypothetical protein